MDHRSQLLLQEQMGDLIPDICIKTRARIDTGMWGRKSPLWICVVGADLVMLAISRRRYFVRKPISDCASSHYNYAKGEFVVDPGEDLQFHHFPMAPRDALKLLKYFKKKEL